MPDSQLINLGIQAAKLTAELIPLCHPLPLTHVDIRFVVGTNRIDIECVAATTVQTGVEMEALTGASVAALTLCDMCEAVDKTMQIEGARVLEKPSYEDRTHHYQRLCQRRYLRRPEWTRIGDVLREPFPETQLATAIIPDEATKIKTELKRMTDTLWCDLVVTTGGTGITPRDVTPEATRAVLQKELPGFGEAMRMASMARIKTAILSRATAGVRGQSLIVNLPGKPSAVRECLPVTRRPFARGWLICEAKISTPPGRTP